MSSFIAIPKRRKKLVLSEQGQSPASSSFASSAASYNSEAESSNQNATKAEAGDTQAETHRTGGGRERRTSLLSSSLSHIEHNVVNVGSPDAPRLITCVRSSQGFDWNQELFLPPYYDHESLHLEHKQDPVEEIVLTEEELASMLPS